MEAQQVTVSGTAGGDLPITSVHVNGVAATSTDGFATWQAVVPLAPGVNELRAEVVNLGGKVTTEPSVTVVRQGGQEVSSVLTGQAGHFVFDPVNRRLLGFASFNDPTEILTVDVTSGYRQFVPGSQASAGLFVPGMGATYGATFDPLRQSLIGGVTDFFSKTVVRVDPSTGNLETVVPAPADVRALTYDSLHDRLLVFDLTSQAILAVDLDSLMITEISSPNVGSGPGLLAQGAANPRIVLDTANDRILYMDLGPTTLSTVLSIDPSTGVRTQVSLSGVQGPFRGAAWDPSGSQLLLLRADLLSATWDLVGVDLQSGMEQVIAAALPGQNWAGVSLAVDAVASRVYLRGLESFRAIDLGTGQTSDVSSWSELGEIVSATGTLDVANDVLYVTAPSTQPGGTVVKAHRASTGEELASWESSAAPSVSAPRNILWDPVRERVLMRSRAEIQVLDRNLQTFSLLSSAGSVGAGPSFTTHAAGGMAISQDGSRIWAADGARLLEVDASTGDRTLIHDPQFSTVGEWNVHHIVADEARGRLLCATPRFVFAYDLATSATTIVSGKELGTGITAGSGPELGEIGGLSIDPETGTLLVSDWVAGGLLSIDPTSGARSFVRQGFSLAQIAGVNSAGIPVLTSLFFYPSGGGEGSGLAYLQPETGEVAVIRPPMQ